MTDEEIVTLVQSASKHLAVQFTEKTCALMAVIRALQSQPGYDHAKLVSVLEALQAANEAVGWESKTAKQAYLDTFQYFSAPPLPPPQGGYLSSFITTPGTS